jgi:hypothetical protein
MVFLREAGVYKVIAGREEEQQSAFRCSSWMVLSGHTASFGGRGLSAIHELFL